MSHHDSESNQWYAHWFDSPFYHVLYRHRDHREAAAFIDRLCAHLHLPEGSTALDLACGKGRHALRLHQNGLAVHGVDLSPKSIAHASKYTTTGLQFAVHDMREPYLPGYFDLVANLFTSFGYFESTAENASVLHAVKESLKPDGRLVVDFMNSHRMVRELVAEESCTLDGITFNITRALENGVIVKRIAFTAQGHDYRFEERVQALTLTDFEQLFATAGFAIGSIFGNYQLQDFDLKTSPRLIVQARPQ